MTNYTPPPSHYQGRELDANTDRTGSNDHEQYPSRMGNELVWRDGRREQLTPESMR